MQDSCSETKVAPSARLHRLTSLNSSQSFSTTPKQLFTPSQTPSYTMCIQYCCKHCPDNCTKLNHQWARQRCNEFYIARSLDENITDCPKGPWELRRAFHRHPYRGSQRCDACKKAGKNKSKLAQSARKKANAAIGELPEYTGALFLGELDLSALDVGDRNAGGWAAPPYESKMASTFSQQRMGEEDPNLVTTAAVGEIFRSPHQRTHQHSSTSTLCKPDEPSRSAHQDVQSNNNNNSNTDKQTIKPVEQTASPNKRHHHQICHSKGSDQRNITRIAVETATSQKENHHHRIRHDIHPETNKSTRTTVEGGNKAASRATPHVAHHNSSLPTCSAPSSQPTRKRPWDL